VRVGSVLAESYSLSSDERDLITAALLLHDITKGIKPQSSEKYYYDPMHPYTAGSFIKKCQEQDKKYASESQSSTLFISEEDTQTILRLIRCHLGPWSPVPETTPVTYMDMIVHLADNISSKLHLIVDGESIKDERWR
jgi:HD superfamily phosphohydrolase YqeK